MLPRPHLIAALLGWLLAAGDASRALADTSETQFWAVHAQSTYVEQETSDFRAPYSGPNSLTPDAGRETVDATLYLGVRPWAGAEAWINPEIDQGFGLSDTHGVAGFPSAEAYRIGANAPYPRLQRLFLRQTIDVGGKRERVAANANQLAGMRSADRWVLTIGKFAITDIFDVNQYAHDPRSDFLNWTAIDAGTFDYAADSWGYTVGAAAERYHNAWTERVGVFDLSDVPNSSHLNGGLSQFQVDLELERRHELLGRPGKLLLTMFDSRAPMGLLDAALQLARETNTVPDVSLVRSWRSRLGAQLGLEQQLTDELGVFARIGKAAGNVEVYEFTEADRTLSAGLSLQGVRWGRPADAVGVVAIDNGISGEREAYLNAGGLGLLIGDGRLPHPGPELIGESYYSVAVWRALHVTLDYQFVEHPGYNRDRGPASVYAVRVHVQF